MTEMCHNAALSCTILSFGIGNRSPGKKSPMTIILTRVAAACSIFLSGISGWRDGVLYPLAGGSRRIRRGAFWLRRRDALLDLLAARW
jgi:hypothetical protein